MDGRLDQAHASATGELTLTGAPPNLRLAGRVQIDRADLTIPDRLPASVVDLNVTFVDNGKVVSEAEPGAGTAPPKKPLRIDLDVAVEEILVELKNEGLTIIVVEQNALAALKVADRAVILDDGQVVFTGTAEELLANRDLRREHLAL